MLVTASIVLEGLALILLLTVVKAVDETVSDSNGEAVFSRTEKVGETVDTKDIVDCVETEGKFDDETLALVVSPPPLFAVAEAPSTLTLIEGELDCEVIALADTEYTALVFVARYDSPVAWGDPVGIEKVLFVGNAENVS